MNDIAATPAEHKNSSATGETLVLIASLGRQDAYAKYIPPNSDAGPGTRGRYAKMKKPLTRSILEHHLNGGPAIGIYPMAAGESRTQLGAYDLDDHDGSVGWERVAESAIALRVAALRRGLNLLPVRSGGGRGIHLFVHWDEPVSARDVRHFLREIAKEVGLKKGSGGIAKGEVEVFPASDRVDADGYCLLIALPFARESVALSADMLPWHEPWLPWLPAKPPPPAPEEQHRPWASNTAVVPIEDVAAALDVIPNERHTDYDCYVSIGHAVHAVTGGSDEGFRMWDAWAARRKDKYVARDTRSRWPTFAPTRTGWGALLKLARAAQPGWQPPSAPPWQRDGKGRILNDAIANLELAAARLGVVLEYDEFARQMLVDGAALTDEIATHLWLRLEKEFGFSPKYDKWFKFLTNAAWQNRFHPVRDYLDALVWDGEHRIDTWLIDYAGAEDSEYVRAVSRLMLVAAVRRVRQPGCKFDEMLVLHSAVQGLDKSTALATLAVRPEWFSDSVDLGLADKETIEQLSGKWLAEISDLRNRSRDVQNTKAFLSRQVDRARKAYGRLREDVPRQCVFFGTTNESQWAIDQTGNRRFWPVTTGKRFDVEGLRQVRDQLWAEAAAAEAAGESIRLREELWSVAGEAQEAVIVGEPWVDVLAAEGLGEMVGKIRSADVWTILDIEPGRRTQEQNVRMGRAMRKLGWEAKQFRYEGGDAKVSGYVKGDDKERQSKLIYVERDGISRTVSVSYSEEPGF